MSNMATRPNQPHMNLNKLHTPTKTILVTFGLCTVLLTGCVTPDLKPFSDSTAQIHNSVVEAQDVYLEEQQRILPLIPEDAKDELQKDVTLFKTNWTARVNIMECMARYAGSLAAVAEAPDKSKASLEGVSKSISEMGVVAGPYAPAVEGAKEIGLELIDLANRIRAAQQLKKAVLATDPEMQKVSKILAADFRTMRMELEQRQGNIEKLMHDRLSSELHARKQVEKESAKLAEKLVEDLKQHPLTNAVAVFNQDMAEVQKYLAESDKWYLPYKAEVAAAEKDLADHVKLFRDTEAALEQWGKAHAALVQAMQDGLAPDWTLLKQSAERIEKSINKITKQEKP